MGYKYLDFKVVAFGCEFVLWGGGRKEGVVQGVFQQVRVVRSFDVEFILVVFLAYVAIDVGREVLIFRRVDLRFRVLGLEVLGRIERFVIYGFVEYWFCDRFLRVVSIGQNRLFCIFFRMQSEYKRKSFIFFVQDGNCQGIRCGARWFDD